jgi:hypothetical protein
VVEYPPGLAKWQERIAEVEVEINGLFQCLRCLRQMLERDQRVLEAPHSFSVG